MLPYPTPLSQPTAYCAHATQPTVLSAKRSPSATGVGRRGALVGGSGAALWAAHPHTYVWAAPDGPAASAERGGPAAHGEAALSRAYLPSTVERLSLQRGLGFRKDLFTGTWYLCRVAASRRGHDVSGPRSGPSPARVAGPCCPRSGSPQGAHPRSGPTRSYSGQQAAATPHAFFGSAMNGTRLRSEARRSTTLETLNSLFVPQRSSVRAVSCCVLAACRSEAS